jgi:hypothetical protein
MEIVYSDFEKEENIETCISRLCSIVERGLLAAKDVSYLAPHFHELSKSDFCRLNLDDARQIVSDSSLKLANEDQLFDFISSRVSESSEFFGLFEFVRFEYLSSESIDRFVTLSEDFYEFLNVSIWLQVCVRLCHPVSPTKLPSRFTRRIVFSGRSGAEGRLNGIIDFLTKQCGGNVHDRGLVNITSLSTCQPEYHPNQAADLNANTKFGSANAPGQWLCYEFREGTLLLTGYSIRSTYDRGAGGAHLKNWVIETSMDGFDWTIVDERTDNADLNKQNVTIWFPIEEALYRLCRFVRLRQTGRNHANFDSIWISSFEVFGDLFD